MVISYTVLCHAICSQLALQRRTVASRSISRGSATSDGRYIYFTSFGIFSVYRCEWSTEKWEELPPCTHRNFGLVIIEGAVTALGGEDNAHIATNTLFTLKEGQWAGEYPPMIAAHSSPAVVSTADGDNIVVIGGLNGRWTATTELFQVQTRQWHQLPDLPQPLHFPSAAACNDQVHVIDGESSGYFCTLTLPTGGKPIPLQDQVSWTPLPHIPERDSVAASLGGQLVILGGELGANYQLAGGKWVKIGSTSTNRGGECLVVSHSPKSILIVGGGKQQNSVEEYIVDTVC